MMLDAAAEDLGDLALAIASGSAVCLLGAGFSGAARDSQSKQVPSTDELTNEIKNMLGIDSTESVSLSSIADYCAEDHVNNLKLRQLLLSRLTVTEPNSTQRTIVGLPWRALFTTNFDDVIERCDIKPERVPITPTTNSGLIPRDKTPVYYLHGRARDLLESDADPALVLSERNYLQLDVRNRDLYAKLFNEIFCARALVIIGYSVRDLDIAKGLLNQGSALQNKSFIICRENEGSFSAARLGKFGKVLSVGLSGFASAVEGVSHKPIPSSAPFQYIEELKLNDDTELPDDDHFLRLVLLGRFAPAVYLKQIRDQKSVELYCIDRTASTSLILDAADKFIQRFIVSSDFGNGKTIFLGQLAIRAIERGYRVFFIKTRLDDTFGEIDRAIMLGHRLMFIIDDVIRYRQVASYVGGRVNSNIILVCTTRGEQDERGYETLAADLGGASRHVDLNRLQESELIQWESLLERWGYWEQRIELSQEARLSFLRNDCGGENRSIVLSLFRDSRIAQRVDSIIEFFLRDTRVHTKAFAGLLISSLCQGHIAWDSIVSWLDVDESLLRRDILNGEIANLFVGGRSWNAFTSSQLAEFILRNRFMAEDRDLLVSVFSTIVLKTAEGANDTRSGADFRENLKELMKFRFLTRLFGQNENAVILINQVYRKLAEASRIRGNPQFWLQYAMSRMQVDDLTGAETYLNNALGLAKERGRDYSPFQILDQRARLYFRKNTRGGTPYNRREILIAIKDLSELVSQRNYDIVFPFRSVPLISEFLELHVDDLDKDIRDGIQNLLNKLLEVSRDFRNLPRAQKGETKVIYKALSDALLILRNS